MLKIRLMRIGAKKKPFYRVVVVEQRSKRTGGYVELLGTYNPLTTPKDIKLNKERIEHWVKQGAQLSVGYLRIIGKAVQKQPRKAKKEKKVEAPKAPIEEAPIATPENQAPKEEVHPKDDQPASPNRGEPMAEKTEVVQSVQPETEAPVENSEPVEEVKQEAEPATERLASPKDSK